MSRNRHYTPNPNVIADALDRMTTALAGASHEQFVSPELLPCRLLDLTHLGMYVEIVPRPVEPAQKADPSIMVTAGILVGIRPGSPGRGSQPADRGLVIAMGGAQNVVALRVDAPVRVFPRSTR